MPILALIFICLMSVPVTAQQPGAGSEDVANELRALTASVDRLNAILEAQAGSVEQDMLFRKLNLAIAYLDFRSRRIEALEQDVQESRNAKAQIESTLNIWIERQKEMAGNEPGLSGEEARLRNEEFEVRIELIRERIERLDDEIVSLESKIYELQSQIDSVEEFVQKNLAL